MSAPQLRKQPTEWLDVNDNAAADTTATSSSKPPSQQDGARVNDWEVIGISSGDTSPARRFDKDSYRTARNTCPRETRRCPTTATSFRSDAAPEEDGDGFKLTLCGFTCRVLRPVGVSELGSAPVIGVQLLLFVRFLFLFIHGMAAGFAYAHRDKLSAREVLSELFIWLHILFLLLVPMLVLSSMLTKRTSWLELFRDEDTPEIGQTMWTTVSIIHQITSVLAQGELARLVLLHFVPSLRPQGNSEGIALLFSLTSPFAYQRYAMVASSMAELVLSTIPFRVEHVLSTVVISIIWETSAIFIQPMSVAAGVKVGYVFGKCALVATLAPLNFLVSEGLSKCYQRRKQGDDAGRTYVVMDV